MAEGTNVGKIFLDLIVRDTIEAQVQKIAAKGQAAAQQAFSGVEKSAEKMANNAVAQTGKIAQKATEAAVKPVQKLATEAETCGKKVSTSVGEGFNKGVALAQAKLNQLERSLDVVTAKLHDAEQKDTSFKVYGYVSDSNKEYARLLKEQEKLLERVEAAEERLAIERETAAQKAAAAAEKAALKQQMAAQRAAEKQAREAQKMTEKATAAAERAAIMREKAEQKSALAAQKAAQKAAAAEEKAANRRKAIHAKMWKNMLSKAGAGAKSILGKLVGMGKGYDGVGKSARRFSSRLREIATGALIFNGISLALRNMVSYFSKTIASTDEMKQALANLKGAAANAASPIIQVLTPALAALANSVATVLSYVERLLTRLTGKISNAAATAQKAAGAAKKATRSLAGFDEIERLGGDSDSSGSDSDSIEPNYDFQGKSPFLDSVLSAINAGQWEQVGALFAQKLNGSLASINWPNIHEKARQWTKNLVDTINGFASNLDWELLGSSIGNGLNALWLVIDTFFQGIDWVSLGNDIATGLNGLFDTIDWELLGRVLTDKFKALFELLHGFVTTFDFESPGSNLAEMFMAGVNNINWPQLFGDISAGIVGLLEAANAFIAGIDWAQIGSTLSACLLAIDWDGMFAALLELLVGLAAGLLTSLAIYLVDTIKSVAKSIAKHFNEVGKNGIQGFLDGMLSLLRSIGTWLYKHLIKPVIDGVKNALGIHSPSTVFAEIGENLVLGLLEGISAIWNSITEFFDNAFEKLKAAFTQTWNNISSTVTGVVDGIRNKVTTTFTSVKDSVTSIFNSVKDTLTTIWNNISSTIKGSINGIIGFINGMISGITSGINTVIRALNKLSFTIPDWLKHVPGAKNIAGKKFGFDIQTITAPQIPYLADGGIIKQPTLAMMGEYSGARNNPEIVTPQSVMAETVAAVMEDVIASNIAGFEAVVSVLREILEAILGIEIGDDVIGQAVERYNRKMAVVKGGA